MTESIYTYRARLIRIENGRDSEPLHVFEEDITATEDTCRLVAYKRANKWLVDFQHDTWAGHHLAEAPDFRSPAFGPHIAIVDWVRKTRELES